MTREDLADILSSTFDQGSYNAVEFKLLYGSFQRLTKDQFRDLAEAMVFTWEKRNQLPAPKVWWGLYRDKKHLFEAAGPRWEAGECLLCVGGLVPFYEQREGRWVRQTARCSCDAGQRMAGVPLAWEDVKRRRKGEILTEAEWEEVRKERAEVTNGRDGKTEESRAAAQTADDGPDLRVGTL